MTITVGREVRRLPVGAEVQPGLGVHFRCWAPRHQRAAVVVESGGQARVIDLDAEANGYFSRLVDDVGAGALYRFRLGEGEDVPDPASRFQPHGPAGPSEVIDPAAYAWRDGDGKGVR